MYFQKGDIIINLKRFVIFKYKAAGTEIFIKDFFRCRLASFDERLFLEQTDKNFIRLKELGVRRKDISKEIKIEIIISDSTLRTLNRTGEKLEIYDYSKIIELLTFTPENEHTKENKELKKKVKLLDSYKKKVKRFFKMYDELKNQ